MIAITTKNASESGGHSFGKDIAVYLFKSAIAVDVSGEVPNIRNAKGELILTSSDLKSAHVNVHDSVSETKSDGLAYLKGTNIKVTDWIGHKYTYDGSTWGNNSSYVAHTVPCNVYINGIRCQGKATMPDPTCDVCGKHYISGLTVE